MAKKTGGTDIFVHGKKKGFLFAGPSVFMMFVFFSWADINFNLGGLIIGILILCAVYEVISKIFSNLFNGYHDKNGWDRHNRNSKTRRRR